ncbi:MAG: Ada metal-binding domain-containing protein [Christensenellales bacterium]|jgi:TolA-binding protein
MRKARKVICFLIVAASILLTACEAPQSVSADLSAARQDGYDDAMAEVSGSFEALLSDYSTRENEMRFEIAALQDENAEQRQKIEELEARLSDFEMDTKADFALPEEIPAPTVAAASALATAPTAQTSTRSPGSSAPLETASANTPAATPSPQPTATVLSTPSPTQTSTETPQSFSFIANKNTKKLHLPSCSSVKQMKDSNKVYLECTRDEAISSGYEPCKNCRP